MQQQALRQLGKTEQQRRHRMDIDGLRALAVLMVVIFHISDRTLPGGYIGVDIFFVISGYLITGIIARDIAHDRFSIVKFYERRIRRIIPALMAVLAGSSILVSTVLLPHDLIEYAKSLVSAVFSYSNFYFWTQSDYFSYTFTKVLLHTWSLAVEEQFYLVIPAVMLFMRRYPKYLRPLLVVCAFASLAVSARLAFSDREMGFFMPYSRAWELLIGSLLALYSVRLPKSRLVVQAMAAFGLMLILSSVFYLSEKTPFPGLAAVPTCIGAAILLATGEGEGTLVSRFFSLRPMVFVGLISYSLYLWHWPIIIFARLGAFPGLGIKGLFNKSFVFIISVVMGWLSWKFVEQPFRVGRWKTLSRSKLFVSAFVSTAAVCSIAMFYALSDGLPSRFPSRAIMIGSYRQPKENIRLGTCFISGTSKFKDYNQALCTAFNPHASRNLLLVGDSHAAALWYGLQHEDPKTNVMQANASGCKPIIGNYDSSDCGQLRQFVFEEFLPHRQVDGVMLTEQWHTAKDIAALEPTITWLKQHSIPVTVIGPAPEYDAPLPMLLALSIKRNNPDLPRRYLSAGFDHLDQLVREQSAHWQVPYLSPWQAICGSGHCDVYANEAQTIPESVDDNHLSAQASSNIVRKWADSGTLR